ncbi:MAG: hypothetical protein A3C06_00610 [Candidatus Taylorbacteria bacterium RIFCSPHIGHO2_02_FULL_46_13]|uniref:Uncharacterized protein n=1 Tax=Candidatus Taylorbacteria bacterium RIFCSPHIGHO2_02_FULL_46_13 TaxID=1802312 RepID=A0A1G2MTZ1_9BACT|nr:MAG: hypothetical protein A3C06_00610 [Candidatus Taylorbacteria bacterium RIFCSPHIGHO2_02_FULL_46_13]
MNAKWRHFLKLFDGTFFKMSLQFLAIVFVVFVILFALGYLEAGGRGGPVPTASPDGFSK